MKRFQSKPVNNAAKWLLFVLGVGLGALPYLAHRIPAPALFGPYIAVVLALGVVAVVTQPRKAKATR